MKIGEVANETGLSISNIRFYEKKGLLSPSRKEESGYRDYTYVMSGLVYCCILKRIGFTSEEILAFCKDKLLR